MIVAMMSRSGYPILGNTAVPDGLTRDTYLKHCIYCDCPKTGVPISCSRMLNLHDQYAIAHATFACIAVLFTLPIALLAGRYLRSRGPVWCRIHMIFNSITVFLIVLVFGLGMASVSTQGLGTSFEGSNSDLHHQVGLAVFILVLIQAILGFVAHSLHMGHMTRKIHIPLGIVTAAGLYWQTWEGMHNEWTEMSVIMTSTPASVQVLFWVFFLVAVSAYMLAAGQAMLDLLANSAVGYSVIDEKLRTPEC